MRMPFIFLALLTICLVMISAVPVVAGNIGETSAVLTLPPTWMVYASLASTLLSGLANFVPRTSWLGKIIHYGALNVKVASTR